MMMTMRTKTCKASALPTTRRNVRSNVSPSKMARGRGASVAVRAVMDVDEASFEAEVLRSSKPVLVDFWASWCGPCKLISKIVEKADNEFGDNLKVVKIECDGNPALVEKYSVYGLPTLIMFKDGEEVKGSKNEGAISYDKLKTWLNEHAGLTVA